MCAASNLTSTPIQTSKTTSTSSIKPEPKWLRMKKLNKSSAGQTAKPIAKKSSASAQKPSNETRNQKRARWAKKARPVAKPVVQRGPVFEYVSACCSVPARKPKAGMKEVQKDPESGKMKDKAKGLGHWRCGQCGKPTKVTPRKPEPKSTATGAIGGTVPDIIYPAKLHTPVLVTGEDLGRGAAITN